MSESQTVEATKVKEWRSGHRHVHDMPDPLVLSSQQGIWAVKWSVAILLVTMLIQVVVVYFSGSVALLADTMHNFTDAVSGIPLWIAFKLAMLKPTKRFTYGYGRLEDLAGVIIVLMIALSAIFAGEQSIHRLLNPQPVQHIWAVMIASLIGFGGNEVVAQLRIRIGRKIGSAALVADGYHARIDGLTSLAVLGGAVAVVAGLPLGDPIAGLLITVFIARIVYQSAKPVFIRMLDGVDPRIIDEIHHAVKHVADVRKVSEVRVRWLGHRLHAEVNIAVDPQLPLVQAHELANQVQHQLLHHLKYLSNATIHVDPADAAGEAYHPTAGHD